MQAVLKNPCGTSMCSCRKHGIKCVIACEDCRGENCNNAKEILEVEEDNFEERNVDLELATCNIYINNTN